MKAMVYFEGMHEVAYLTASTSQEQCQHLHTGPKLCFLNRFDSVNMVQKPEQLCVYLFWSPAPTRDKNIKGAIVCYCKKQCR